MTKVIQKMENDDADDSYVNKNLTNFQIIALTVR